MNRPTLWPASIVVTCLAAGLMATLAAGQAPSAASPQPWERADAFQFLLLLERVDFVASFADLRDDPQHSFLVVLGGDLSPAGIDAAGLARYLHEGGAALMATDQQTSDDFRTVFRVEITGEHLRASRPGREYRGKPECPFVTGTDHPLFAGLHRIATNVPSRLTDAGAGVLAPLAFLKEVQDPGARFRRQIPFAELVQAPDAGDEPMGCALLLADHSLFINDMMLQSDNDNLEFGLRCVRWLSQSGQRGKVLFVAPGRAPPVPPVPVPPVAVLNELIAGMEREDLFNKVLLSNIDQRRLWGVGGLVLAMVLLGLGVMRAMQAKYRVDPATPLFAKTLAKMRPGATLVKQRHQAMLESGGLWELARERALQACADLGCAPAGEAPQPEAPSEPRLTVGGGWWQRQLLRRRATRLWHLARSVSPEPITARSYSRILEDVETIQAAAAEGILHFGPPGDASA